MPRRRIRGGAISADDTKRFIEQSYVKSGLRDDAVGDYVLDRDLSSDRAAVYHNAVTNQTLVCNAGTRPTLQDWSNNARYVTGTYDSSDRLAHAMATQEKAIQKYGSVDTNIGHSQGAVITRKLNEAGKTGEIINLNGASMFEPQAGNETRIRANTDVVSGMAAMAPSRKRNVTIAGSWNPLTSHSASIMDRMNPMHMFGNGSKKISHAPTKMPHIYRPDPPTPRYMTDFDGGAIVNRKKLAAVVRILKGAGMGHDIAHALGKATIQAVDDSSTRLSSAFDGSDPHGAEYGGSGVNRLKKAGRWTGFVQKDLGMQPIQDALVDAGQGYIRYGGGCHHCGFEGGFVAGSEEAKAHGAKMRAARKNQERYVKGSASAKEFYAGDAGKVTGPGSKKSRTIAQPIPG